MAKDGWTHLGAPRPFDPSLQFVTSPFLSPLALGVIRLLIAVYTFTTLLTILIWQGVKGTANSYFSYFTELSYIGLCAYYWAAAVQTLGYAHTEKGSYPLQRWPRFLQFLHSLLWSTITVFPFIVTPVFWALLAKPSTFATLFSTWENISIHALNSVFALFEVFFSNVGSQPWLHVVFLILLLGGYLGVAYITHATQGFYTYPFLDPKKQKGKLAIYIVGIALAAVIIFAIGKGICWLKQRFRGTSEEIVSLDEKGGLV